MQDFASLGIRVDASDARTAAQDLERLGRSAGTAERGVNSLSGSTAGLGRSFASLGGYLSGLLGVAGLGALGKSILDVNRSYQTLRTSLETVTGSAERAKLAFAGIQQFAANTPYEVDQVTEAFIKLKNSGLDASTKSITSYGNTASALGRSLNQVIDAVADATHGQYERLIDAFGVTANKMGDQVAFTFKGVTTVVDNNAQAITGFLQKIGNTDFAGGMDRQAKTIDGALSTLKDTAKAFFDHILTETRENQLAQWATEASNALHQLDLWFNGASSNADRLELINNRIAELKNEVSKPTAVGMLKDFFTWTSEEDKLKKIDDLTRLKYVTTAAIAEEKAGLAEVAKAKELKNQTTQQEIKLEEQLNQVLAGKYRQNIVSGANKYGVDPAFMLAIAQAETNSGANIKASSAGAQGLMQIMPATAAELARQMGTTTDKVLHDIQTNADAAALYVKQRMVELTKAGKLTVENLAASYNAGLGNLKKADFNPLQFSDRMVKETIPYMQKVVDITEGLHKQSGIDPFKGMDETLKKAAAEQKSFNEEGQRLRESIDPITQYQVAYATVFAQFKAGNLSMQEYNAWRDRLSEQLTKDTTVIEKQTEAQKEAQKIIEASKTDWDNWADSISRAGVLLADGEITVDTYNAYITKLHSNLVKVKDATTAFDNEMQNLGKQRLDILGTNAVELYAQQLKSNKELTEAERQRLLVMYQQNQELKNQRDVYNSLVSGALSAFDGILSGQKSFGQAFIDMFSNMLNQARSKFADFLVNDLMSKNWGGVFQNIIGIATTYIPQLLAKSAPTTASISTATNSNGTGSGAMSIADNTSRQAGFVVQTQLIKDYNNSLNTLASGATALAQEGLKNTALFKAGEDLIKAAGNTVIDGVKSVFPTLFKGTIVDETVAGLGQVASKVMVGIGAIYSAFDYFSGLGDMLKRGNIVEIASKTGMLAGSVTMLFNPVIGGIIAGISALIGLFTKVRIPNNWINTFNPLQGQENPNKDFSAFNKAKVNTVYIEGQAVSVDAQGLYAATGNKSAVAGVVTEFGATQFSSHEMKQSIDDIKNQFGGLLGYIKVFDNELSKAVGSGAMEFYSKWIGDTANSTIKLKQNAKDLDVGEMLFQRYDTIINKLSESGDAKAQTINNWFDAIASKFQKTDKNFESLVFSIVGGITSNVDQLAKLPASLAKYVADSVKGTKSGATVEQVLGEIQTIINVYDAVSNGLTKLGSPVNGDAIVKFLADMNAISFNVKDAGANLLSYAEYLKVVGKTTDIAAAAEAKLANMRSAGASNETIAAYFSTAGSFAQTLQRIGASFDDSTLDKFASHIGELAKNSQQAAKDVIDHAIASEKLGNMSRDAAIQLLVNSKKLDENTVKLSEFGGSINEFVKQQAEGLSFVAGVLDGTGVKFDSLGLSANDLANVTDNLIARFGSMKDAIQQTADFIKNAFGDAAYAQYSSNQAFKEQEEILKRNPEFAKYGLYAGMNSQNIQDANIAASKATGIDVNQLIAGGVKLMAENPDLQRFVALAAQNNQTASKAPIGYQYNTDFKTTMVDAAKVKDTTAATTQLTDTYKDQVTTLSTIDDAAQKAAENFKTLQGIIDSSNQAAAKIPTNLSGEFATVNNLVNTLLDQVTEFKTTLQTASEAGASYAQLITLTANAMKQAGYSYAQALASVKSAYASRLSEIDSLNQSVSDTIFKLKFGDNALNSAQAARYKSIILNSDDYAKQMDAARSLQSLITSRYETEIGFISQIHDLVDSLKVNKELSPLGNFERMTEAAQQFSSALSKAKSGDTTAQSKLSSLTNTYLSEARSYFGGNADYAKIFNEVTGQLEAMGGFDDVQTLTLKAANKQIAELQGLQTLLGNISAQQQAAQESDIAKLQKALTESLAKIYNQLVAMAKLSGNTSAIIDLSSEVLSGDAKASLTKFKDSIIAYINSGLISAADAAKLKDDALSLVTNLSQLLITQKLTDADVKFLYDAENALIANLATMINAQKIDAKSAGIVFSTQLGLINNIAQLLNDSKIDKSQAIMLSGLSLGFINALVGAVNANKLTAAQAQPLYVSSVNFVTSLADAIAAGKISGKDIATLGNMQNEFLNSVLSTLTSARVPDNLKNSISDYAIGASDSIIGALKKGTISVADADSIYKALYGDAGTFTQLTNLINSGKATDADIAKAREEVDSMLAKFGIPFSKAAAALNGLTVDASPVQASINSLLANISAQVSAAQAQAAAAAGEAYRNAIDSLKGQSVSTTVGGTDKLNGFLDLPKFALGGIATSPSIFGEAGAEAAVPLPDGRTIPVTLTRQGGSDPAVVEKLTQAVQELQAQNQHLIVMINDLRKGFTQNNRDNKQQLESLQAMESAARINA